MKDFVGVIGGMGPDATVLFLKVVADRTVASRDQDHIDIDCLQHSTISDRTAYILDHTQPNPLPDILEDVRALAQRGATLIAIPCNTAHYFYDEIQQASPIPVLNMIELAVGRVVSRYPAAKRVAVLGTRGTVNSGLYHRELARHGIEAVTPPEAVQRRVDHIIFRQVKGHEPLSRADYEGVLRAMADDGCDVCLVGCTELSVPEQTFEHESPTVDALVSLADATIVGAGKQVRVAPGF